MGHPPKATRVRVGNVSIPVSPHAEGWRFGYKDDSGKWRYVTRRDRTEAVRLATAKAAEIAGGACDLHASLDDPALASVLRRAVEMRLTHADLDRLALDRARVAVPLSEALAKFLDAKRSAKGLSARNINSLESYAAQLETHFGGDTPIDTITPEQIEAWMGQPFRDRDPTARTRRNRRAAAVTAWRWFRARNLLPDTLTAAERTERPIVVRKIPPTWTPAEFLALLDACPPSHYPWLLLAGNAGPRASEFWREATQGENDVIRVSDLHLDRADPLLEVRPEVGKTGATSGRRLVPLTDPVASLLRDMLAGSDPTAPVGTDLPAWRKIAGINRTITSLLGDAVGGWKENALRNSRISYRASLVGLSVAALEAGNSESEARKSYNDAMPRTVAEEWFSLPSSEVRQKLLKNYRAYKLAKR